MFTAFNFTKKGEIMRDILFRGKTIKKEQEIHAFHNVWVEGDLIKNRDKWHIHPKCNCFRSEKELAKCMIAHEIIPETIGQFTGLTDKNGKKIFEGDIVELYDKNADVKWKAVIVFGNPYSNYSWGWELLYIGQNPKINTDILCWVEMEETGAYCEVIGNIHDNPELLEK